MSNDPVKRRESAAEQKPTRTSTGSAGGEPGNVEVPGKLDVPSTGRKAYGPGGGRPVAGDEADPHETRDTEIAGPANPGLPKPEARSKGFLADPL